MVDPDLIAPLSDRPQKKRENTRERRSKTRDAYLDAPDIIRHLIRSLPSDEGDTARKFSRDLRRAESYAREAEDLVEQGGRLSDLRGERRERVEKGLRVLDKRSRKELSEVLEDAARPRLLDRVIEPQSSGISGSALGVLEGLVTDPDNVAAGAAGALGAGVTAAAKAAPKAAALLPALGAPIAAAKAAPEIAGNAARDLINIPAQVVPSTYALGREVVEGRPEKALEMLLDPIVQTAKDPVGAFEESPVGTGLMASGAKAAVTRPVGEVVHRTGKAPKRRDRAVPGTNLREERAYSRDALTMLGQIAADHARSRRADRVERKAKDDVVPRAEREQMQRKADELRGTTMRPREVSRRVDERVAATEDVRRANRGRVLKDVDEIIGRKGRARSVATVLVAQNITKATKQDLRAYLRELEAEAPKLSKSGKAANRELRRRLTRVLKDPRMDLGEIEVAARRYAEYSRPLQQALVDRGLLDAEQVARAAVIPYAVRAMGAMQQGGKLVAKDGSDLPTAAILEHMKANKVNPAAFVSQAPAGRSARAYYVASDQDPRASSGRRTGKATREGTFDASPQVLRETAARSQGLADAADGFRAFVDEFGVRSKSGRVRALGSYAQARKAAEEMTAATGGSTAYVPVRLNPFGTRREQTEALLEQTAREPRAIDRAIEEAISGAEDAPGPFALVPETAANRLREHMRVGGSAAGKLGDVYGSQFRKVVLSTSPKWIAGNVAEAGLRSAIAGAGPRSYLQASKVLKALDEIDPKAGKELRARAVAGGHFSLGRRASVHRSAEDFAGTRLEPIAQALGKVARTPGPKQAVAVWNAYTDFVMGTLNGRLEMTAQQAMLGKALRRSPLLSQRAVKLGRQAVKDAAEGLRDTNAQVAFAREVDKMYGRYGKFSPTMRRAIASYTPFIAWWTNAVRFIYATLPRDHPVLTGLLAAAHEGTEEWRQEIGQDVDTELPGFLWGSIPAGAGSWRRASDLTPFGAATDEAGPLGKLPGLMIPQYENVLNALEGKDWRGYPLRTPDGRDYTGAERAAYAAKELVSGIVPVLAQGLRASEREGSPLDRVLEEMNPVRRTGSKKKDSAKDSAKSSKKPKKARSDGGFWGNSGGSSSSGGSMWGGDRSSGRTSSIWE